MRPRSRLLPATSFLLLVLHAMLVAQSRGPADFGDLVAEPEAAYDSLHLVHEQLTIDLRPLASHRPAVVEATYRIRNLARGRRVEFAFTAVPAGVHTDTAFEVMLDGMRMPGHRSDSAAAPAAWSVPATTPPFDGADTLRYEARLGEHVLSGAIDTLEEGVHALVYPLDLTTGVHTVRVRYRAYATANSEHPPVILWQFAYILAPLRRWTSVGGLDAAVYLPHQWEAAVRPDMHRIGDTLSGSWKTIPVDALTLTLRLPPPSGTSLTTADVLPVATAIVVALALMLIIGTIVGRALGRRGRSLALAVPIALVVGIAGAAIVFAGHVIASRWYYSLVGNQFTVGTRTNSVVTLFYLWLPASFTVGTIVTYVAAGWARRGERKAEIGKRR